MVFDAVLRQQWMKGIDTQRNSSPMASWAYFAPSVKESAGRKKGNGSTGHGDPYLARVLGEAAAGASRTNPFLGERYRRIARSRGKKREQSWQSAVPSWSSSGTSYPIPKSVTTTWVPTSTTHGLTQNARSATISANSKHSATRSPCSPLPDPPKPPLTATSPSRLRFAPPRCCRLPAQAHFRARGLLALSHGT